MRGAFSDNQMNHALLKAPQESLKPIKTWLDLSKLVKTQFSLIAIIVLLLLQSKYVINTNSCTLTILPHDNPSIHACLSFRMSIHPEICIRL